MKFYQLDEVPAYPDDQVFKVSPVGKGIALVVMWGLAIASLILAVSGWKPRGMTPGFFYYFAAVVGLFGLIPFGMLRASLRPTAWLARCTSSGIIIKFRSYQNWRLPGGTVQAVGFDYSEIAWVKMAKETRTTPSMDKGGTTISFVSYLDLALVHPDTSELEANLEAERNIRPDGMVICMDYPVQVAPGGIVEISWSDGISPSASKAVEILGRQVKTLPAEHRKVNLTRDRHAAPADERAKIVQLVKSGDPIGAAQLARQVYGYSATEASDFVKNLPEGEPPSPASS